MGADRPITVRTPSGDVPVTSPGGQRIVEDTIESTPLHVTDTQRDLLALCAIRIDRRDVDWSLIAREVQIEGGLEALWKGEIHERSTVAEASRLLLRRGVRDRASLMRRVDRELHAAEAAGATVITILDDAYPPLLRLIPDPPPFLFVIGEVTAPDAHSVAFIGADASTGTTSTRRLTELLVAQGVTIVTSDEHDAIVDHATAHDGRALGVLGAGIATFEALNAPGFAAAAAGQGAVISPFWPTRARSRSTARGRDQLVSALSQAAVVVEEPGESHVATRARTASTYGKKVFIWKSRATKHARGHARMDDHGAIEVRHVDEIVGRLAPGERVARVSAQRRRLTLGML